MQEPKTLNDIYEVTCGIDRPAIMKYKSGDQWVDVTVAEFRDTRALAGHRAFTRWASSPATAWASSPRTGRSGRWATSPSSTRPPSPSRSIRRSSAGRSNTSSTTPARSRSSARTRSSSTRFSRSALTSPRSTPSSSATRRPRCRRRALIQRRRGARQEVRGAERHGVGSTSRASRARPTTWPRWSTPPAPPATRRGPCSRTATSPATP